MPIDISRGSLAAVVISALFWWTVLSPAGLLVVNALCGRRPRLRAALSLTVLVPPIVTLLPVAVMHGGGEAVAAAAGAVLAGVAIVLAVAGLGAAKRAPVGADRYATGAFLTGVAGGMLGSLALVGALLFS